jgi:hypothetical protein
VNATNGNDNGVYVDGLNGRVIRGQMIIQGAQGLQIIDGGLPARDTATAAGADGKKALAEVSFDAYDVTGKLIPRSEALKRLKAGGMVIIAGDNRFPDADYLKAFRGDILIIASNELVFPAGTPNPYDVATGKPAAAPPPAAPAIQAVPGIRIAPAAIKRAQIQIDK